MDLDSWQIINFTRIFKIGEKPPPPPHSGPRLNLAGFFFLWLGPPETYEIKHNHLKRPPNSNVTQSAPPRKNF